MNETTVFIYLCFFVALFAMTFAYMFKVMTATLKEMDRSPTNSYGDAMKPYRTSHPEMQEVKNGDELLVFRGEDEDDLDD